jgi:hypothetical protein
MEQEIIKKNWIAPELEIISKDVVKLGSISTYPEGAGTPFGGTGSGS